MASGKVYVVDDAVWRGLPQTVRAAALAAVNAVFRFGGDAAMKAVATAPGSLPSDLRLTDAVVRVYPNSPVAAVEFRREVHNQILAASKAVPAVQPLLLKFRKDVLRVEAGRAYSLKAEFPASAGKTCVCVTDAAVSLHVAYTTWNGLVDPKTDIPVTRIAGLDAKLAKSFGETLGRLIAHEARHQLAISATGNGLDHSGSGLGADCAQFSASATSFSSYDRGTIQDNLRDLDKLQGKRSTVPIRRHAT